MRLISALVVFSLFILISACSSGPSEEEFSPRIGDIFTDIINRHPSYFSKSASDSFQTIEFTVSVNVTDPDGLSDLQDVYIHDSTNNWYWSLLNSNDAQPWSKCHQGDGLFSCYFYSSNYLHDIKLKGYEIVAVDLRGYTTRKSFEFRLPGGEIVDDEVFVFSESFTGDTVQGIPALETMNIIDNEMAFSLDSGSQVLHLEFSSHDNRAQEYSLELFDGSEIPKLIGTVSYSKSSIVSTPIIFGQKTIVDIPFSEITFVDGFGSTHINGLHVILYDEPVEWTQVSGSSLWSNYVGFSEFISLDP